MNELMNIKIILLFNEASIIMYNIFTVYAIFWWTAGVLSRRLLK